MSDKVEKTVCHMAAQSVVVETQIIQRCAICGAMLTHHTGPLEMEYGEIDPKFPGLFLPGQLVRQEGDKFTALVGVPSGYVPPDLCIDLVEK